MAYPNAVERRDFFARSILSTKPSAANQQLAALLGPAGLGQVVLTTNFDDHLSRAAEGRGLQVVTYSHPEQAQLFELPTGTIQIIQAHGSFQYYDCCNTQGEIRGRARNREMLGLVQRMLDHLPPIVLGYAGWPDDVVMRALRARLTKRVLPYNLYWFCYRPAEAEVLPRWLTRHECVKMVVPRAGRETLPAIEVLEHFGKLLDLSAEPVTASTLQRTAERLTAPGEALKQAEIALGQGEHRKAFQTLYSQLYRLYRADLAGDTSLAAGNGHTPIPDPGGTSASSPPHYVHYQAICESLYYQTWESDPRLALAASELRCELTSQAADRFAADRSLWQYHWFGALHGKGVSLRGLGRHPEALEVFGRLRVFYQVHPYGILRVRAARARVAEGVTLFEVGRHAEAHACWEAVSPSPLDLIVEPGLPEEWARALFNRGLAWLKAGFPDAAREVWDELAMLCGHVLEATDLRHLVVPASGSLAAVPVALALLERARALLLRRHANVARDLVNGADLLHARRAARGTRALDELELVDLNACSNGGEAATDDRLAGELRCQDDGLDPAALSWVVANPLATANVRGGGELEHEALINYLTEPVPAMPDPSSRGVHVAPPLVAMGRASDEEPAFSRRDEVATPLPIRRANNVGSWAEVAAAAPERVTGVGTCTDVSHEPNANPPGRLSPDTEKAACPPSPSTIGAPAQRDVRRLWRWPASLPLAA